MKLHCHLESVDILFTRRRHRVGETSGLRFKTFPLCCAKTVWADEMQEGFEGEKCHDVKERRWCQPKPNSLGFLLALERSEGKWLVCTNQIWFLSIFRLAILPEIAVTYLKTESAVQSRLFLPNQFLIKTPSAVLRYHQLFTSAGSAKEKKGSAISGFLRKSYLWTPQYLGNWFLHSFQMPVCY